jgi:hypothetical protein
MSRSLATVRSLVSITVLGALAACGGSDSTGPGKQSTFTSVEATTVATNIMTEIVKALSTAGFGANAAPVGAVASVTAVPVTGSANFSGACTSGGTVSGHYDYTGNFDNQGGGTMSGTITSTLNGCKVSTGTKVIGVGGQFTWTYSATFSQTASLNTYNWHGVGSFTWDGGSCSIDYAVNYTGTGAYKLSGTFCGVDITQGTK